MQNLLASLTARSLLEAAAMFFGFVGVLFVGSLVVPGKVMDGVLLADGSRQRYRLNGFALFVVVALATAAAVMFWPAALLAVHERFWPLLVVANVVGFGVPVWLARGKRRRADKAKPGPFLADYFYGVEINPTVLGLDLKMFSYRPSLMGLGLLNVSFAVAQHAEHGAVSTPMWLYQVFYLCYLANYFQFEYGMLYTWDLIAEKFGWMLVWGDYVLVPFFYSIPGWYLIDRTEPMPLWQVVLLSVLYLVGFVLFRGTNQQKHQFKADPSALIWGRAPETVGGKLLASGFWGIGRKLNYTGELCMYYAWTLPTGTGSLVPYLLPLWLTVFFPHRAWRDEQRCSAKYGALWTEYCQRARFRMIPFLY